MSNYNLYIRYSYGIKKYPVNSLSQVKSTACIFLHSKDCLSVALVNEASGSQEKLFTLSELRGQS